MYRISFGSTLQYPEGHTDDPFMKRAHINSSVFEQVGYDLEKQILELKFKDEKPVWQYLNLPLRVFRAFMRAASKGRYFVTKIRGKYPEKRVN